MKKLNIKSVRGKNTVASLVAKKVEGALSIFSEAPTVEIKELCEAYTIIRIYPEKASILTFAEIDTVREAVDVYKNKYEYGCVSYDIDTIPYLASDNETWLSKPCMEISVRYKNW